MKQTCETAAALFPHSLYCGFDWLVATNFKHHALLEINAFGDLYQGLRGMDCIPILAKYRQFCQAQFGKVILLCPAQRTIVRCAPNTYLWTSRYSDKKIHLLYYGITWENTSKKRSE